MRERIYLDGLATTRPHESVKDAMASAASHLWGYSASRHSLGKSVRKKVEEHRNQFQEWAGLNPEDQVVFCSSSAEALNMGLLGLCRSQIQAGNEVVIGQVDHPTVKSISRQLSSEGFVIKHLRSHVDGSYDYNQLEDLLNDKTVAVCLQAVNHDFGTIQSLDSIDGILKRHGIPLLVDASYATGWIDHKSLVSTADAIVYDFHRCFGPPGIAALSFKSSLPMHPLIHGGSQENGWRAGPENLISLSGLSPWIQLHETDGTQWLDNNNQLYLHKAFNKSVPWLYLNGPEPGQNRVANNLNYSAYGIEGEGLVLRADLKGVMLGSGSACMGSAFKQDQVLEMLKAPAERILSSFTLSPNSYHTRKELDLGSETLIDCIKFLRNLMPDWEELQKNPHQIENQMAFPQS